MIADLIYLMDRLIPDNTTVWEDIYYLLNVNGYILQEIYNKKKQIHFTWFMYLHYLVKS